VRLSYLDEQGRRLVWQEGERFFLDADGVLYLGDLGRSREVARVERGRLLGSSQVDGAGNQEWLQGELVHLAFPELEAEIGEPLIDATFGLGVAATGPRVLIHADGAGLSVARGDGDGDTLAYVRSQAGTASWTWAATPGGSWSRALFFAPADSPWLIKPDARPRARPSALAERGAA